jgi:hypothetical protein
MLVWLESSQLISHMYVSLVGLTAQAPQSYYRRDSATLNASSLCLLHGVLAWRPGMASWHGVPSELPSGVKAGLGQLDSKLYLFHPR